MRRAALLIWLALAAAPSAAPAQEYELPANTCGLALGVEGLYAEGADERALCPVDRWEIVTPPTHGTVTVTREFVPWIGADMWRIRYLWAPGVAVGTEDSYTYRLHSGDRASAVITRRLRLLPPLTVTTPRPAVAPPVLSVRVVGRGPRRLRLATICDVACIVGATVTRKGERVGAATRASAGTLAVPLARSARHGRLVVTVTAAAPSGATDTWRLQVPPQR